MKNSILKQMLYEFGEALATMFVAGSAVVLILMLLTMVTGG